MGATKTRNVSTPESPLTLPRQNIVKLQPQRLSTDCRPLTFDPISPFSPLSYDISRLEAGTPIYARVSAHTPMSYGYPALPDPEFATPSNVQPGAPPSVRLSESTDSSITVRWDHPTVDGGSWHVLDGYMCFFIGPSVV